MYNPEVVRIWPSREEEEEALRVEAEEAALLPADDSPDVPGLPDTHDEMADIDPSAFNAATGSYSGLYGQKPVDADTQAALDAIMNATSNQNSIDSLLAGNSPSSSGDIITPPDQDEVIREANEIYERLLREAAEDEAKKQAEIDEMRKLADEKFSQQ